MCICVVASQVLALNPDPPPDWSPQVFFSSLSADLHVSFPSIFIPRTYQGHRIYADVCVLFRLSADRATMLGRYCSQVDAAAKLGLNANELCIALKQSNAGRPVLIPSGKAGAVLMCFEKPEGGSASTGPPINPTAGISSRGDARRFPNQRRSVGSMRNAAVSNSEMDTNRSTKKAKTIPQEEAGDKFGRWMNAHPGIDMNDPANLERYMRDIMPQMSMQEDRFVAPLFCML